jgi:hypothetical protein
MACLIIQIHNFLVGFIFAPMVAQTINGIDVLFLNGTHFNTKIFMRRFRLDVPNWLSAPVHPAKLLYVEGIADTDSGQFDLTQISCFLWLP